MIEQVGSVPGDILPLAEYNSDFFDHWQRIPDRFDKLERIQHFQEPEDPSWDAFAAGDWEQALAIMDRVGRRGLFSDPEGNPARLDMQIRRLRVISLPIAPYVQWECQFFRHDRDTGEQIRVLKPAMLAHWEVDGPLPELVVLGPTVMYEVLYTADGILNGGRRILDGDIIAAVRADFDQLWETAEDFTVFFDREIADLPPPVFAAR
jgi:Family of unknown function (DUF6879)